MVEQFPLRGLARRMTAGIEPMAENAAMPVPIEARRCPLCHEPVTLDTTSYRCVGCRRAFSVAQTGQGDFRLAMGEAVRGELLYTPMRYDAPLPVPVRRESPCPERRNDFRGEVPWHLTRDQISYIPQARPGEVALDLGCGTGLHRPVLEALAYEYYGVDYSGAGARDLIDAHALPYRDDTFDLILAIALTEHLAQPFLALAEAARVLKPGGYLIGTAAFLEPFHDNSFFHFSPLGVTAALAASGLQVETLQTIRGWNVLRAQLEMGFERAPLPRAITYLMSWPFVAAMETYALIGRLVARDPGRHSRDMAQARHSGAFFFLARKQP
jgi:SAM-dependent methyltransferase